MTCMPELTQYITSSVKKGDDVIMGNCEFTQFHCRRVPQLGLVGYMNRLTEYMMCSEEAFVIASLYIERIREK